MNLKRIEIIILITLLSIIAVSVQFTACTQNPVLPSTIERNEYGIPLEMIEEINREMTAIQEGEYIVGDDNSLSDRRPERKFTPEKKFSLGKTEVINKWYSIFIEAGCYTNKNLWDNDGWEYITKKQNELRTYWTTPEFWEDKELNADDQPVVGVSYYEAKAFAKAVGMRLPTELEWEAAARGLNGYKYPWGNEWKDGVANLDSDVTTPVMSYKSGANESEIYDLVGNVREWTDSLYEWYPDAEIDPENTQIGKQRLRVLRGSGFKSKPQDSMNELAHRSGVSSTAVSYDIGFRLAKDL